MQSKTTALSFTIEPCIIEAFFFFLQGGFTVKAHVGYSIRDYLCKHCGIEQEYITKRISTVFLDQKPVDNMVMRDLGPGFLERGIYTESGGLKDFLLKQQDDFRHGCRKILLDGVPFKFKDMLCIQSSIQGSSVFLTVITYGE